MDSLANLDLFTSVAAATSEGLKISGAPTDRIGESVNQSLITRIIVVSVIIWLLKEWVTYFLGRFQLIHHLYHDITARVDGYVELWQEIRIWRAENLEPAEDHSEPRKRRFSYIKEDPHIIYRSTIDLIVKYLWMKEIDKIHGVYRSFLEIEEKLDSVGQILKDSEYDIGKLDDDDREWISDRLDSVQNKVTEWSKLKLRTSDTRGRGVARDVFYPRSRIYFVMLSIVVISGGWLITLIIEIAKWL